MRHTLITRKVLHENRKQTSRSGSATKVARTQAQITPIAMIGTGTVLTAIAIFTEGLFSILGLGQVVSGVIVLGVRRKLSIFIFLLLLFLYVLTLWITAHVVLSIAGDEYWGGFEMLALALFVVLSTIFGVARVITILLRKHCSAKA